MDDDRGTGPMDDLAAALGAVDHWPVPHAGVVVTTADGETARHGETDTVLPIASLTKPIVAWAVLVTVAEGLLALDDRVGPTGPEGATVRHLLAHAAGLDGEAGGRTLAPGTRRIYSNWGYEVLGELLAERHGRAVAEVVATRVLAPLGMSASALEGSPAHGVVSTVTDLARFAREVLRPTLLPPDLAAEAVTVAFPGLDGVLPGYGRQRPNDWALGLEVRGTKDPHWGGAHLAPSTVGHFGRSGSLVWADPTRGVALATLSGCDFGDWARQAWPALGDAVITALDARRAAPDA